MVFYAWKYFNQKPPTKTAANCGKRAKNSKNRTKNNKAVALSFYKQADGDSEYKYYEASDRLFQLRKSQQKRRYFV